MRRGWIAAVAVVAALVLLSCVDDAMGPAPLAGRFALNPHFASPHAGIVPINRFRLILRRLSNDSVALDTVVAIAPGDTAVDLSFTVPMFTSTDQFVLFLRLITPEGDTAFAAGPDIVSPSTGGIPPQVPVDLEYIGPGSNAAGVRILTLDPKVFFGQSVPVMAEAFDSADNAIPGTPIGWRSLDTLKALVPHPAQGQVVGAAQRGTAPIVATLLTGPADTIGVLVQPLPVRVSIDSGNGQTAAVGAPLASPVVALVKAADSLGVAGVVVRFTVAAGSLTADSGVTNASGHASVGWTLSTIAGLYALTAKVTGIPDSVATAIVTALATDPSPATSVVTVSSSTVTAGSTVTLILQAKDAEGNPLTGGGATVVFAATGGTSTGTIGSTTDHGDGTYSATFTGAKAGAPTTIGATINGDPVTTLLPAVTVTPAAASKLAFEVVPISSVAGGFITPGALVKAVDPFGNTDPTFSGTVTLLLGSPAPGPGTLFGTLAKPALAGAVTFTDLMIDKAGSGYTLVATSGTLTSATSTPFDIIAPTPAIIVWSNISGGNWNNPANWVQARVPSAGDTVLVTQSGTYTVTLDVNATVKALQVGAPTGTQTLLVDGPTLTVDSSAIFLPGATGVLDFRSGAVTGAGTVTIGGQLAWSGGAMSGTGATLIASGAFATLSGAGTKTLDGRQLRNAGTLTWAAGPLSLGNGAQVINEAGAGFVIEGDVSASSFGTPPPSITNAGTLTRAKSTGTVALTANLNNTGTIDILTGVVDIDGAYTHGPTATIRGPGTFDLGANGLSVTGTVTVSTLVIAGPLTSGGGTYAVVTTVFAGSGPQSIPGALVYNNVTVTGTALFDQVSPVVIAGNLAIAGTGRADVENASVTVGGGLSTEGSGALSMIGTGSVSVGGDATFNGGSTSGLLTSGTLAVAGRFGQSGNASSFASTGTHVVLNGSAPQTVSFASPGPAASRFFDLTITNSTTVDFATDFRVDGLVQVSTFGGTVRGAAVTAFVVGGVDNSGGAGGSWDVDNTVFTAKPSVLPNPTRNLEFQAGATLSGSLTVNGNLSVTGGTLDLFGNTVNVNGSFKTSVDGTLTMLNPSLPDQLNVTGDVTFAGGKTATLIDVGIIRVGGNFTQSGDVESFHAGGTNIVEFNGSGPQTIFFTNPGIGPGLFSHFANITFAASNTVTLLSDVFAHSNLSVGSTVMPTIAGGGKRMAVGGLNVIGLTLNRVLLEWNGTAAFPSFGTFTSFSNVTFTTYDVNDIQFTIIHPGVIGSPDFTFSGLSFDTAPSAGPGFYVKAEDSDGVLDVLEVQLGFITIPEPCTSRGLQALKGALIFFSCS